MSAPERAESAGAKRGGGAMRARLLLGAVGVAGMGVGLSILLTDRFIHRPLDVVWWLAGAVVLHDGVLVPVVLALGALLRPRGVLRAGLITGGCVTVAALPVLFAPRTANPTVLPLDYPRGWLLVLAAVAALTLLALAWTASRSRRHRHRTGNAEGPDGRR